MISAKMHRLAEEELPFERLVVDELKAREIFSSNQHKLKQIPDIAKKSPSGTSVTLYRVKDHIDISSGPMMANTSFLGRRCTIAAVIMILKSIHLYITDNFSYYLFSKGHPVHKQWNDRVSIPRSCITERNFP